jgi:transcriptional regulator with XRE-family HTH domain
LENIIAIRCKCGFSQENIADAMGIKQGSYSLIENGKRELKYDTLLQIAIALNIDVIDIITYPKKYVVADNLDINKDILDEKVTIQIELTKIEKDKIIAMILNKSNIAICK